MTKFIPNDFKTIATLAGLLCVALPMSGHAQEGTGKVPTIIVQATGYEQAKPDIAIINLAVQSDGKTADSALSANNTTMNKVLKSFHDNGIEPRDLTTSDLSIYQIDRDNNDNKKSEPLYRVSNSLSVRVRDISKAGKIFDEAMKLGVNSVNGISFANADTKPFLVDARKKAVSEAFEKAKTLAEAAHVKLGSVITISEDNAMNAMMPRLMSASAPTARSDTNFATGELDYKVNVTVTFAIDQ